MLAEKQPIPHQRIRFPVILHRFCFAAVATGLTSTPSLLAADNVQKPKPQYQYQDIEISAPSMTEPLRPELSLEHAERYLRDGALAYEPVRSSADLPTGWTDTQAPGRYELRSRTTVLDMLALVGGLNQFASRTKIFVLRPDGTTQKRLPFNYNKAVLVHQANVHGLAGNPLEMDAQDMTKVWVGR